MKKFILLITIACTCTYGVSKNYYKEYTEPSEIKLKINQLSSIWGYTINNNSITIPDSSYLFANDYAHLQTFDSISYNYDSWTYEVDSIITTGTGAPFNIVLKGYSEKGDIHLNDSQGVTNLNGYYYGIELKTWNIKNTTVTNLEFTFYSYPTAIREVKTSDHVATYILTGDCNNLPAEMYEDLATLMENAESIRFDITRMRNPKNFCFALIPVENGKTPESVLLVGGPLNSTDGLSTDDGVVLTEEETYEVPSGEDEDYDNDEGGEEEPAPFMQEGIDFHVDEPTFADSVSYTRKLSVNADSTKNMNSLILPFDIEVSYLVSIDATPYTISSISGTTIKTRKLTGTIPANTPFIIKRTVNPKDTVLNLKVYNVDIPATPDNLQNGYLVGVYEKQDIPVGCKIIHQSVFKTVVGDGVYCAAFTAFVVPNAEDYYETYVRTSNNTTTSLQELGEEEEEDTIELINLLGMKIKSPVRGVIYIQNGKKRMVK